MPYMQRPGRIRRNEFDLNLFVLAKLRGQVAEAPGDVAVAPAGADRAVLGVDQRSGILLVSGRVVEAGARVGLGHDLIDAKSGGDGLISTWN